MPCLTREVSNDIKPSGNLTDSTCVASERNRLFSLVRFSVKKTTSFTPL